MRRCLEYALEARRRVKEQLKKIGGMEFFDVHFSYIDQETMEEKFISVPEQGGGSLIPDGPLNPGVMHTVATGSGGHLGLYRLETQVTVGQRHAEDVGPRLERRGQGRRSRSASTTSRRTPAGSAPRSSRATTTTTCTSSNCTTPARRRR